MGLGVQPYNYTFSLWPLNFKPSILTFKVWDHWSSEHTLAIRQVWPSPTCLQGLWGYAASAPCPKQDYKENSHVQLEG